jgi:predicted transcriptional regulator
VGGPLAKPGDAIISIRPNFAEAILSGAKTVELRRRIPPIEIGTRLWIYATRPTAAVVGSAIVNAIVRGTPDSVWDAYSTQVAISRDDYDGYFDGANEAIGISLAMVCRINPVEIKQLRQMRDGFHPPQVIAKLSKAEAHLLIAWSRPA